MYGNSGQMSDWERAAAAAAAGDSKGFRTIYQRASERFIKVKSRGFRVT